MKLLTFVQNNQFHLGVKMVQGVLDVASALTYIPSVNRIPTTIHE